MRPTSGPLSRMVARGLNSLLALVLASALAAPATAEAQRAVHRDGSGPAGGGGESGGSGSGATPSGGSGGATSSSSSSDGASRRQPPVSSAPTGSSSARTASPSGSTATSSRGPSGTSATTSSDGASSSERSRRGTNEVPNYSRPRGDQTATGTAVARRGAPPYGDGGDLDIYVPGGYYPWGYGGFGFGGYYGGYYDPWYPYDAYYGTQPYYANVGDGSLRLKVKPREAAVYADGYYVGRVDDFDGMFQRLHIEPGPHRIEIRADGYETLEFEVRLLPDRTLTYEGELKPLP